MEIAKLASFATNCAEWARMRAFGALVRIRTYEQYYCARREQTQNFTEPAIYVVFGVLFPYSRFNTEIALVTL